MMSHLSKFGIAAGHLAHLVASPDGNCCIGSWTCRFHNAVVVRAKLEVGELLANCEIKDLKISKKERSVPELRSHHRQEKERFRLDRINLVRRHCVDPVPDNDCVDSREDGRCFKIASKIVPHVAHRALLTSFELVQEAKKGNLTKVAAVRFDGYGSAFSFDKHQMTEVADSDSVSTASANATIFQAD